jgi:hypothetical protein
VKLWTKSLTLKAFFSLTGRSQTVGPSLRQRILNVVFKLAGSFVESVGGPPAGVRKNQGTGFAQHIPEQKKTGAFQRPVSFVAIQ